MSRPVVLSAVRTPVGRYGGALSHVRPTLGWRFPNPRMAEMFPLESMGETGENVAERWGVSRDEQDAFAASGARLVVTLLHGLRRRAGRYGLATLCVGVGQGQAALFER